MPHKCTRCKQMYRDESAEMINGCACGSRVFEFVKESNEKHAAMVTMIDEGRYEIRLEGMMPKKQEEKRKVEGRYDIDLKGLLMRQ